MGQSSAKACTPWLTLISRSLCGKHLPSILIRPRGFMLIQKRGGARLNGGDERRRRAHVWVCQQRPMQGPAARVLVCRRQSNAKVVVLEGPVQAVEPVAYGVGHESCGRICTYPGGCQAHIGALLAQRLYAPVLNVVAFQLQMFFSVLFLSLQSHDQQEQGWRFLAA